MEKRDEDGQESPDGGDRVPINGNSNHLKQSVGIFPLEDAEYAD